MAIECSTRSASSALKNREQEAHVGLSIGAIKSVAESQKPKVAGPDGADRLD